MKLLTKEIKAKLLANGAASEAAINIDGNTPDHVPVLKLFNPCGAATWLVTELDEDEDRAFGLCDLGQGTPELGYLSLSELASLNVGYGLGIERDQLAKFDKPVSVYAKEARANGGIPL
jgi:hypothetical protein